MELTRTIKQCRLERKKIHPENYTLKAVADRIGVSESYLSRLERQVANVHPNRQTLIMLLNDINADQATGLALFGYLDIKITNAVRSNNDIMPYVIDVVDGLSSKEELFDVLKVLLSLNNASLISIKKLLDDF